MVEWAGLEDMALEDREADIGFDESQGVPDCWRLSEPGLDVVEAM